MNAATSPRRALAGCCLVVVLLSGCGRTPATPPARAPEKPKVEGELAYTTLSGTDAAALKIVSRPITTGPVQEHLQLTGWIMAPQGNEVTITAPVAGYVRESSNRSTPLPVAGRPVAKDQELFTMRPVLSPLEAIQLATLKRGIEGELKKAESALNLAKLEQERTLTLFKQKIKQQQDVDLAEAKFRYAEEDLAAAKDKLSRFASSDVPIVAPRAGTVLIVNISPGQYVPAAAPLLTVADLSTLWVRVQVPERDFPYVDRQRSVDIKPSRGEGRFLFTAKPVAMVPLVDMARHTADMIYELQPKGDFFFAKDQMVSVLVPVGRKRTESVVPYSAVIFDAHGGAWIYLDRTPDKSAKVHRYERRRVELGAGVEGGVVVRPTVLERAAVVVEGAALLFSREFHKTPVHPVGP